MNSNDETYLRSANHAVSELDDALNAAEKAIELEPNLGAGYYSLGYVKTNKGEWIEAESAYRKALELPTETLSGLEFFLGLHYGAVGNIKMAFEILEEIRKNDPLNSGARTFYIISLSHIADAKRAEDEYERCRALFGDHWDDGLLSGLRLLYGGTVTRDKIVDPSPIWVAAKEHLDSPEAGLVELQRLYSNDNNLCEDDISDISSWAAYFGDPEFAMDAIEKAYNINASGLFKIWVPKKHEVRQLPRFKEFVREIGLVDYWEQFGWPDICHKLDNSDFVCD